jgi:hypothetical protein
LPIFEGFTADPVEVGEVALHVRHGGAGPPKHDDLEELYGDPLAIWRDWAGDLRGGGPIESGHHMAEEAPDELAAHCSTSSGIDHKVTDRAANRSLV